MKCFYCNTQLRWHGDSNGDETIITTLLCPNTACNATVIVYYPIGQV